MQTAPTPLLSCVSSAAVHSLHFRPEGKGFETKLKLDVNADKAAAIHRVAAAARGLRPEADPCSRGLRAQSAPLWFQSLTLVTLKVDGEQLCEITVILKFLGDRLGLALKGLFTGLPWKLAPPMRLWYQVSLYRSRKGTDTRSWID